MNTPLINESARLAQLYLLDRIEGLELAAIDGPRVRLTLPVYAGGSTRDTRDLQLMRVGEGLRTPAVFAVVYGNGSTVYRRSARLARAEDLVDSIGHPERVTRIFEPFRGLPARLLGWAAERSGARAGIRVDADEAYNDRDPFEMLAAERVRADEELVEASRRWAEPLRGPLDGFEGEARRVEAGRRLSALLLDPGVQHRYAGRWFESLVAPDDPYWTFEAGGCGLLALALGRELGGELVTLRLRSAGPEGEIEHVALRIGDRYLDVRGLRTASEIVREWAALIDVPTREIAFWPAREGELLRHFGARPEEISALAAHVRLVLPDAMKELETDTKAS